MATLNGFSAILAVLLIAVNSQELVKGKSITCYHRKKNDFVRKFYPEEVSRGNLCETKFPVNCTIRELKFSYISFNTVTSENFLIRFLSLDDFLYSHYLIA